MNDKTYILKKVLIRIVYNATLLFVILFIAYTLFSFTATEDSKIVSNESGIFLNGYINWLQSALVSFDFGQSLSGKTVLEKILHPFLTTLTLTFSSLLLGFLLSIIFGWIWSKKEKNKLYNTFFRGINFLSTIPLFLAAFIIAYLIKYVIIDISSEEISISHWLIYYSIPVIVLTMFDGFFAEMINFIKLRIDEISGQQFMIALELRGGNIKKHFFKHIFHGILTIINSRFLQLIGGAIIVEIIFGWQGIGLQGFEAVIHRDYHLFMGVLFFVAVVVIIFNMTIELTTHIVNKKYNINI